MIGTTAAIIGAAAIGAGSSLYASGQAAKGQKQALAAQRAQYNETKSMLAPYTTSGANALGMYETALGLKGKDAQKTFHDDFQTDPGWVAAQNAGLQAVDDRYRLSGSSGGNMRAALYDYGQRNMLSAYEKRLSQLGGLVDGGRSAASSLAGFSSQLGSNQANALAGIGQTQAEGAMGIGKAIAGGLSNIAQNNQFSEAMASGLGGYSPGTAMNGGWATQTVNNARRVLN